MNKYTEALKIVEKFIGKGETYNRIKECTDRKVPKYVIIEQSSHLEGEPIEHCPVCNVVLANGFSSFCPRCGQALKERPETIKRRQQFFKTGA